jgi:hypothetical protein
MLVYAIFRLLSAGMHLKRGFIDKKKVSMPPSIPISVIDLKRAQKSASSAR